MVLEFLMHMYENGCKYSGICAARSALSNMYSLTGEESLAQHPLISRFVKGIYNLHPPVAKYTNIWDINLVLDYYAENQDNSQLTLKELTMKFVLLLMILGARRKQAIVSIDIDNVVIDQDRLVLLPNRTLKHSKPGNPLEPISYKRFSGNKKLCVVHCAEEYLAGRKELVSESTHRLLITFGKPHREASPDTVSRWIKNALSNAGIDINIYKAHSCRAAAASKVQELGAPLHEILKHGCWKRKSTFTKYYSKDIIGNNEPVEEADLNEKILENYIQKTL